MGDERRQERKVVTVLFCDLVGFTQRAEEMDPEDVASLLGPYHARLKEELERYGGTVEKFIGDAVMALFGAPTAHEDDPERAVRAAFAIHDFAEEEGIELRIGITTGEALVTIGARPDQGETMATGDVVNTAARLQAAAPVNGVLVSEKTHEATKDAIEYADAEPVEAKGKSQPIRVWQALRPRSRITLDRLHGTPLVGRTRELDLLVDSLTRARAERQPQLVTLVGVPGIGKSRLVYELSQAVDRDPELISWRQGRCLPYGEGVTFWALGEIVKAHLGILETDAADVVEEKLLAVGDEWIRKQLRPLLGLVVGAVAESDGREEAFSAWRLFVEGIAAERVLVLVFEDLHWADENLLDFVDHLVDWASGVPLLVVCTARPELLERRTGWGGGKPNASTISLSPLSDQETAHLLTTLLERVLMPADTQAALLGRAGGNPLYAEHYVRMLQERAGAELSLPETVQGIIAARLDGLEPGQKALLQDASVVGKVFWLGAVTAISGRESRAVETALHALERKGFVRRERETSIEGDTEYAFLHVVAREVAYGQIPRGARSEKHRLAAEWIDALGRADDHAEMLVHHYGQALELARAAGAETAVLEEPARHALRHAGDRAMALNAYGAALRFYEQALELWPEEDAEWPMLLFRRARAVSLGIDPARLDLFEQARDALLAAGDRESAAEAETFGALALRMSGRLLDALDRARSAVALLEDAPPSRAKAHAVANLARLLAVITDQTDEPIEVGKESLAMAQELGLHELRAHALNTIGLARVKAGDFDGIDQLEESLRVALEHGSPFEIGRVQNNLAFGYLSLGRVEEAVASLEARLELAERLGAHTGWERSMLAFFLWVSGRWGEAEACVDVVRAANAAPILLEPSLRGLEAEFRLARDDIGGAASKCEQAVELLREQELEYQGHAVLRELLALRAKIALAEGRRAAAEELVDAAFAVRVAESGGAIDLAVLLRDLGRSGDPLLELASSRPRDRWWAVSTTIVRGELAQAADRLAEMGAASAEAQVRLRAASELVSQGRRIEADEQLRKALAFYRSVGATRYIREGEALLAATA